MIVSVDVNDLRALATGLNIGAVLRYGSHWILTRETARRFYRMFVVAREQAGTVYRTLMESESVRADYTAVLAKLLRANDGKVTMTVYDRIVSDDTKIIWGKPNIKTGEVEVFLQEGSQRGN